MTRALPLLAALALVACASPAPESFAEPPPAGEPAVLSLEPRPAPNAACPWVYQALWQVDYSMPGCRMVRSLPTTGSVVAPLAAGAGDRCDVASFERAAWATTAPGQVVLWQREGETQPPQFAYRDCEPTERLCDPAAVACP